MLLQVGAEVIVEFLVLPDNGDEFLQPRIFDHESHVPDYPGLFGKVEFENAIGDLAGGVEDLNFLCPAARYFDCDVCHLERRRIFGH